MSHHLAFFEKGCVDLLLFLEGMGERKRGNVLD